MDQELIEFLREEIERMKVGVSEDMCKHIKDKCEELEEQNDDQACKLASLSLKLEEQSSKFNSKVLIFKNIARKVTLPM